MIRYTFEITHSRIHTGRQFSQGTRVEWGTNSTLNVMPACSLTKSITRKKSMHAGNWELLMQELARSPLNARFTFDVESRQHNLAELLGYVNNIHIDDIDL